MQAIRFEAKLFNIGSWVIPRLPEEVSALLPSRGQTMVEGTINGFHFQTPVEPDGKRSHWFRVEDRLLESVHAGVGDSVNMEITPIKKWVEPNVPADLNCALAAAPKAYALWQEITTMAHWEWIRWIRSTNNRVTRNRRIEVAISKLNSGKRRPCCFNRNLCTEPSVSKNGMLLEPVQSTCREQKHIRKASIKI